jgi:hypothetical protein
VADTKARTLSACCSRRVRAPTGSRAHSRSSWSPGVSRKTISPIEAGRFVPSTVISLKISVHFGVPVEEIFCLAGEPEA